VLHAGGGRDRERDGSTTDGGVRYDAKFWDCCNKEAEDAEGCCVGVHMGY